MKTKQNLIVLLLIFGVILNTQAQFFDKIVKSTEKKIEREAENRTQRKIDKKIDEAFDETEDELKDATKSKKSKENKDERQEAEVESSYTFDVTATMLLTSFEKHNEDNMQMKQSYSSNALMSEVNSGQKMLFVTDFKNDIAIMINPETKTATLMSMEMMKKFMKDESVANEESSTAKMIKTGATKTINGYKCYQYIITDKNTKIDAWFAPNVDFDFQKHLGGFSKMFGKKQSASSLLNKGKGYVMEFTYFEKGVKKSEMKVTNFSKTPRTITMNDYTIQSMF